MGTMIELTSSDGFTFGAYRADPSGPARAGVVVVQEIFGVNGHIRSVADGYAAAGYLAIAPALFDRAQRDVQLGYTPEDIAAGRAIVGGGQLTPERTLADIAAAAAVAAEAGKVGVVGYCWGGMQTARAAIELGDVIAAAASYYGGTTVSLIDRSPVVPLIAHYGELDHAIPLDDVEKIRAAWPMAEVHLYPGAQHGFNCDHRASYDASTADLARQRTLAFFAAHL